MHFTLTSSVANLNIGRSYAWIILASFDHQKKSKRSFFARNFEFQKYSTKRSGLLMFYEIGKLQAKKVISSSLIQPGVCSKCAKS